MWTRSPNRAGSNFCWKLSATTALSRTDAPSGRTAHGAGGRLVENFTDTPPDLWRSLQLGQDLGELPIEIAWPMPKRLGGFGTVFRTEVLRKLNGYDQR